MIAPSQPQVLLSIPETVTLPPPAASVTAPTARIAVIEVACFSRDVMVLRDIQWTRTKQRVALCRSAYICLPCTCTCRKPKVVIASTLAKIVVCSCINFLLSDARSVSVTCTEQILS